MTVREVAYYLAGLGVDIQEAEFKVAGHPGELGCSIKQSDFWCAEDVSSYKTLDDGTIGVNKTGKKILLLQV